MQLSTLDLVLVSAYVLLLIAVGLRAGRGVAQENTNRYFLAGRSLNWWTVGASLIAVNITAAAVISMSGASYAIGLAMASYEWLGAVTLLIIGKFFLPVFLQNRVQTLPQFLALRYHRGLGMLISLTWIAVYIFIGLVPLLWLAASVVEIMSGMHRPLAMVLLGLIALACSLRSGLSAIAMVDNVQLIMLIAGGLLMAWISLDAVAGGQGPAAGLAVMMEQAPERLSLILARDDPNWQYLPGLATLGLGMWVLQLGYLGFNQYILQRALAAKDLREAQAGALFAAWLKLLMPVLLVLPGLAAWILYPGLEHPDQAYPAMMGLAPPGLRGLVFAALTGAAVAALSSLLNSIATLFTVNLYRPLFPASSEGKLLWVGRRSAVAALLLSILLAYPLLGETEQSFQYMQNFASYLAPGVCALFLLGMYWPGAHTAGAGLALAASPLCSALYQWLWPELPFMIRTGHVFCVCAALAFLGSLCLPAARRQTGPGPDFSTARSFNLGAAALLFAVAGLYWTWW